MKIKILLLIIIFLLACKPIQEKPEPTYVSEKTTEPEREEYIPITDFYKIKPNETIIFDGIPITLTELKTSSVTIKVKDIEKTFTETNIPKIIHNLEISVFLISYDPSNIGANKVVFKINKFEQDQDQYLMYLYNEVTIKGITLRLLDVKLDRSVFVDIPNKYVRKQIKEGQNIKYGNLNITNIRGYFGGTRSEKYALLEIK